MIKSIWNRIGTWIVGAVTALLGMLWLINRNQSRRIERQESLIEDQDEYISTSKRINRAGRFNDAKEAKEWLERHAQGD